MEENNSPTGFVPPVSGSNGTNPVSPDFASAPTPPMPPAPPMPDNPPMGGTPETFTPPTIPTAPSVAPTVGSPVPPPPPKQVDIRTMASDQTSLKASGGMGVTPQTVKPFGQAPKKIDSAGRPVEGGGKKKAMLIGLGIVVFLATAAAVANYFVLPLFLQDTELTPPPAVVEEEVIEEPTITPTIPTFTHVSYFAEPVDVSAEVNVSTLSLENIKTAMTQTAASRANGDAGMLTEFEVTQGLIGAPVTSEEFLSVILPDVQFTVAMEDDFTGFMYDTGTEVRAGYIFALDVDTADLTVAKAAFGDTFEASTSLANLFLVSPGTAADAGFKNGAAVSGVATRWLAYSNTGTSIDYGWKGPFVIVSTSFDGFKAVVPKVLETLPSGETSTTTPETATTTTP